MHFTYKIFTYYKNKRRVAGSFSNSDVTRTERSNLSGLTIDHKNKSKVDQHLNTKKHKNNKTAIERRNIQVNNKQNTISEKDELNLELVKVFTAAIFLWRRLIS